MASRLVGDFRNRGSGQPEHVIKKLMVFCSAKLPVNTVRYTPPICLPRVTVSNKLGFVDLGLTRGG